MKLEDLATKDYQNRDGGYVKSGIPNDISVFIHHKEATLSFKNTTENIAVKWSKKFMTSKGFTITEVVSEQTGDYQDDWVDVHVVVKNVEI